MKLSKFGLAVRVLLVATVMYAMTLALCVLAYNTWVEDELLKYPEYVRLYVDFFSFWATSCGTAWIIFGMALMLAWVGLLAFFW